MTVKKVKLPKVREYKDALFINNYEVPFVVVNNDGTSITKTVNNGDLVEVTITFCAESYYFDPHKNIHRKKHTFNRQPWYKRLFFKLNTKLKKVVLKR